MTQENAVRFCALRCEIHEWAVQTYVIFMCGSPDLKLKTQRFLLSYGIPGLSTHAREPCTRCEQPKHPQARAARILSPGFPTPLL